MWLVSVSTLKYACTTLLHFHLSTAKTIIYYKWLIYLGSDLHFTKIFNGYIYLVAFQTLNDHFGMKFTLLPVWCGLLNHDISPIKLPGLWEPTFHCSVQLYSSVAQYIQTNTNNTLCPVLTILSVYLMQYEYFPGQNKHLPFQSIQNDYLLHVIKCGSLDS